MIKLTPWDSAAFGLPTWEVCEYSAAALQLVLARPGHHTIKVDPLADKAALQAHGFYYCDTLIETSAVTEQLRRVDAPTGVTVSKALDRQATLAICHGAFAHGRFHRDFSLARSDADLRYNNWLSQLLDAGTVYGLYSGGELAGFIGFQGSSLVLHAIDKKFRGRGLSKFWWCLVIDELFASGHMRIGSSISASNMAVLNLYASLGFSFFHPQDIYHCLVS